MAKKIAAEAMIARLADWGVDTVFGLPGDGINGIMEGLRRHRDRVRFVLVHHEEAAAFMATAYAKATGRIGVCLATSGPGGIHLANGLYDARLDHAPVLAITGMQETAILGTSYQQEVDLVRLFQDVAEYNQMITNPAQLPALVDIAVRTAYARRGVAHLTVPNDIQVAPADLDPYDTVAPVRPPETAPVYLAAPSEELMADADTLLMLGTNFPYSKFLPPPGQAKVVQIDIEPTRAGTRIPTDVPLVGDVATTLDALLPLLSRKEHGHLSAYQEKMADWRAKMAALESAEREPIAPQFLASRVDRLAADDAVLTCDSGTIATWAARHWQIRGGREFYLSGTLASMAPGLPYAIAIQHAHPGRQVIAFVGDGGFAMLMAEFHTAVRYALPVKVVINNNNSLGQILWEQMVLGYPEHGVRFGEPPADYAAWARACGGNGVHVDRPGELDDALREAFAQPGPALVDVAVDPDEPPLPGKVGYDQAKKFAQSWLRGQPHKAAIATTLFKDRIQQLRG